MIGTVTKRTGHKWCVLRPVTALQCCECLAKCFLPFRFPDNIYEFITFLMKGKLEGKSKILAVIQRVCCRGEVGGNAVNISVHIVRAEQIVS
jgi:hypothetical protein